MENLMTMLNKAKRDRLRTERTALDMRREALKAFVESTAFIGLPWEQRTLLSDQLGIMDEYSRVLGQRIDMNEQV